MHDSFDIVVSGNGLVGKTLALALAQGGLQVALLGRSCPRTRVLAVTAGPWQWLETLAPGQELVRHAQPVTRIQVQAGKSYLTFSSRDTGSDPDTPLSYIIEESKLEPVLASRIKKQDNITCIPGPLQSFETGKPGVYCQVCNLLTPLKGRLLAGCDGADSLVRTQSGIDYKEYNYRASALNCVIEQDSPVLSTARQNFLPDGPLALLPMPSGQTGLIFTMPHPLAKALMALDEARFVTELRARSNDFTGSFRLVSPRQTFPVARCLATRLYAPGLVLAGDAAHRIHPLAGQGLNLGLADVAVLSAILRQYWRCGLDPGAEGALSAYEKARRPEILGMIAATETLVRLFRAPDFVRSAAAINMQIWGRMGVLRRIAIDMACHTMACANASEINKAA